MFSQLGASGFPLAELVEVRFGALGTQGCTYDSTVLGLLAKSFVFLIYRGVSESNLI